MKLTKILATTSLIALCACNEPITTNKTPVQTAVPVVNTVSGISVGEFSYVPQEKFAANQIDFVNSDVQIQLDKPVADYFREVAVAVFGSGDSPCILSAEIKRLGLDNTVFNMHYNASASYQLIKEGRVLYTNNVENEISYFNLFRNRGDGVGQVVSGNIYQLADDLVFKQTVAKECSAH